MYTHDVSKKRRRDPTFVPPTWTSLPETVQRYYTKKLYHETKLYMRRYDEFISVIIIIYTNFQNILYRYIQLTKTERLP